MDLSKRWLNDYVDVDVPDREFSERMTISGSKVESYHHEGQAIKNVIVGRVESIERHEQSDHLWICQLNVGAEEPVQIVTGAQNLSAGDVVPVAMHKSVIADGTKITRGKMRGVMSNGMLCSLGELGLTLHDFPYAVEDGIFVLGDDCDRTLGADIHEALGFNDVITEFEITSNRPDCLSVIGLAREASATFDRPLHLHTPVVKPGDGDVSEHLKVDIEAPDKCYRYDGAVVQNVRVAPSPKWIRERLRAAGVRPINNIVDITNFVMLEYGQPMHAFDLRYLDGGHVIVRNAKAGETITTLDGEVRPLTEEMLVIADEHKPVAVAGVMGGEYSGIMDDTSTIVFESACFNGPSVRRTAKGLGMRTEASARFEKELNPDSCNTCLARALELVQELDAGDVVNGTVDNYASPKEPIVLPFEPEWTNAFIGIEADAGQQAEILRKIGFTVENNTVTVPSFRTDIFCQADLSEEVARFYGYNNIPNTELRGTAKAALTPRQKFDRELERTARASGLSEIQTFSFMSPKAYDRIRLPKDSPLRNSIVISNPLGEDTSVMRTTSIPSMLDVLSRNYNNRNETAALYENATSYIPHATLEELPDENQHLIIGMYGKGITYFTLKGIVENILKTCGVDAYDIERVTDDPTFHPGRTAEILVDGKRMAILGELHPETAANYEIETRAYIADVDTEFLFAKADMDRKFRHLPKFPGTSRDLAFVIDRGVPVLKLERAMEKAVGHNILESIDLFDVYTGSQIDKDKKSAAFTLKFRSADRTLTDDECNTAANKAVKAVEAMGGKLRS